MEQRLSLFNNTTSTNNVSIIEMTKQQEIIRDRPIFIGIGIILFILIEVIGNGSLLTMIIYEKYGMDIKKRTVNNQLLSSLCKGSVFCNVLEYPFIWARISFSVSLGMFHKKASHLTNSNKFLLFFKALPISFLRSHFIVLGGICKFSLLYVFFINNHRNVSLQMYVFVEMEQNVYD